MEVRTYIDDRGRLVLPQSIKKHLNYKSGDKVILRTVKQELHVINLSDILKEVQMMLDINDDDKKYMLDDFIESKRIEGKRENEAYRIVKDREDTNDKGKDSKCEDKDFINE